MLESWVQRVTVQYDTLGANPSRLDSGGWALGLGIASFHWLFVNSFLMARSRGITQVLDEQAAGLLAQRLEALGARRA